MKLKQFFFFIVFLFSMFVAFSEEWFVCLGSFSDIKNARSYSELLESYFFKNKIARAEVNGKQVYRVLYGAACDSKEKAQILSERLYQRPHAIPCKLDKLWVCTAENFIEFDATKQAKKSNSLKSNTENKIPISTERPYSVQVGTYKEETPAIRDKERLEKKNIEAYILKTYDDDTYISFDLHAGAFETKKETEEFQKKLKEIGIEDTKISDYEEIKGSIEKFNSLADTTEISSGEGQSEIPNVFSPEIKNLIAEFPVNPNFQIETIEIFDMENIRKHSKTDFDFTKDFDSFDNFDKISAISKAVYKDELYNKKLSVKIYSGKDRCFENIKNSFIPDDEKEAWQVEFRAKTQVFDCFFYNDDGIYRLLGTSKDSNKLITMEAFNFSNEEFTMLLGDLTNDSNLLVYPEIRKNLLTLPKASALTKRSFIHFKLEQIDENYAKERGYANWSRAIVGHWKAGSLFIQDEKEITTGFFDMDYNYNAKQVHTQFMEAHENTAINDDNHPSQVFDTNGWYIGGNILNPSNELSFSKGSYIIAVNSCYPEFFLEDELKVFAKDLQIWDR